MTRTIPERRQLLAWLTVPIGVAAAFAANPACARDAPGALPDIDWAIKLGEEVNRVHDNIVYRTVNGDAVHLDVYAHLGGKPRPTLIYFHGGGWMPGYSKDVYPWGYLPFLELGWNVINVDYRPSTVAPAPAAVEDGLCALRWVSHHIKPYNVDPGQVVAMGHSAGGLIALTTGMIAPSSELNPPCSADDIAEPGALPIQVAAIINWFGITDVADVVAGPNRQNYAAMWVGARTDRMAVARQVSPLTYANRASPPIISIHGERDPLVPYSQAARLHRALDEVGTANALVTVPGGGHGRFGVDATRGAYRRIFAFLKKAGLVIDARE